MTAPSDAEAIIAQRILAQQDRTDLTCRQKAREITEDLRICGYEIKKVQNPKNSS